ncbi:MAG: hypothetical protein ACE363_03100 [Alphaproteobacteria bacterium]
MNIKFLTPTLHGLLDYGAAAGLVVLPFLLGLNAGTPPELWLSIAAGLGLIGYSLVTDYALSVTGLISYRTHLALDITAGLVFVAAPFVLGFSAFATGYYVVMGVTVWLVVAISQWPEQAQAG